MSTSITESSLYATLIALAVLATPVVVIIEAFNAFFTEAGLKSRIWVRAFLRLGPLALGVLFTWLMPGPVVALAQAFGAGGEDVVVDYHVTIPAGIVTGFVATTLHAWGATSLLSAWLRGLISKKTGQAIQAPQEVANAEKKEGDPPSP